MTKNKRKTNKNKDKVPPASAQQCSEPVNDIISNGESERVDEVTSDVNTNRENSTTSSNTLPEDQLSVKPEPPGSNLEELTQIKNTCRALKSNLNTVNKKYEDEKKEKENLLDENQLLKAKLSSLEMELQAAKMQIEQFKKKSEYQQPLEDCVKMEIDQNMDDVSEQPQQKSSDVLTRQGNEDTWVQNNDQGTREESSSAWDEDGDQDCEMVGSVVGEKSGLSQGTYQEKADNCHSMDRTQWGEAAPMGARTRDVRSNQPQNYSAALGASGSAAGWRDTRGHDMGQRHNERRQPHPPHGNAEQHYPPRHFYNDNNYRGRGRGIDGNDNNQNYRGVMDNRAGHGQNYGRRGNRADPGENYRGGRDNRGDLGENYRGGRDNRADLGENYRGGRGNRGDLGENYRGRRDNRGDHGRNYDHDVNNRDGPDQGMKTTDGLPVVTEISGDLFDAPGDFSLAHCVAEDMRMGSGIAVTFKQKFKHVDDLLAQRKGQGNVAVLEQEGRYIYYLVTKRESTGKPTMDTLRRSLEAMREHVIENQVKKIAMPRIGCGLDRLEWSSVRPLIEYTFSGTGAQIIVYNYNEEVAESSKPKPNSNVWLKNAYKPVVDIDAETAILCLCAADGSRDSTFELLDRRFKILSSYQEMDRKLGNILEIPKKDYLIFLLIVKETKISPISFKALGECIRQACKVIDKKKCYYVAIEAFDDTDDSLLFEKVITVVKTYLDTKHEKELWLCWPKTVTGKYNTRPMTEK